MAFNKTFFNNISALWWWSHVIGGCNQSTSV